MKPPLPGKWLLWAARAVGLCSLALFCMLTPQPPCAGQETSDAATYTNQSVFRIPFKTDPNDQKLKQVYLYYSVDQGKSWHPHSNVKPESGGFTFNAPNVGEYWFAVRTVDNQGRAFPLMMNGIKPGLKVIVDRNPPVINLRAATPRDGQVGVDWDIREENPDFATFVLEYRSAQGGDWTPLRPEAALSGTHYWRPMAAGTVEVRLRLRDRASNDAVGRATLQPVEAPPPAPEQPVVSAPPTTTVQMVNSKRFNLNYEIKEVGKSGVSVVELWSTTDGRKWEKHSEQRRSDGNEIRPPYEVRVEKEGLYGFSLVVLSGVGLGMQPPQPGDPPQKWIEVDLTRPVVRITRVDVGRGNDSGNLTIYWVATDKNMGRQPITLGYSEKAEGPVSIIASNRENTGRYVWKMPPDVPFQFFVRVEAVDRGGNVGFALTPKAVNVDLAVPKPVITGVDP